MEATNIRQESPPPLLIHSHIHKRRTGVSSSVTQLLRYLSGYDYHLYTYGAALCPEVARIDTRDLISRIRQARACVWHAHRNNEVMVALLLRRLNPAMKIVYTRHSATPPSWLTRLLLQKSDAVVALTRAAAAGLPAHTVVVPHGVDMARFVYTATHSPRDLGIERAHLIGVVGRVRHLKGQHIALAAAAPILRQHRDWGFLILGRVKNSDQGYYRSLLSLIEREAIAGQVYFVDEVSDAAPYYRALSILAVPSLTEGFSMVTLEGMARGCEVVATRGVGIHDELLVDGVNGRLAEAGSVSSMSEQLALAVAGIEGGKSLGRAAYETVRSGWSAELEAQRLDRLYRSLLSA